MSTRTRSRSSTKKKPPARARTRSAPASRSQKRQAPQLPRLPEVKLEQHQLDLIGLGLVALAAFLSFVFYLGWDGGKVGEGLASMFIFLFGGVGYVVPVAMFGTGAVLVLKPLLPSVRPFRSGAICLFLALMIGLAAGSFGLGPDHPARDGFFHAAYFRHHGGVIGDGMYFVAKTLFSSFGAHIIFVFLLLAGILLLTGASVAGVLSATREGVAQTTRRVRSSTGEFAALVTGRRGSGSGSDSAEGRPVPRRWDEPLDDADLSGVAAAVEPVRGGPHVEAPAYDPDAAAELEPDPMPEVSESELSEEVFEPPPPPEPVDSG